MYLHKTAELCAEHLGDVVHDLTAWAHQCGVTEGVVTVLIIDPIPDLTSLVTATEGCGSRLSFGSISLGPR